MRFWNWGRKDSQTSQQQSQQLQRQQSLEAVIAKNRQTIGVLERRQSHLQRKIDAQEQEARTRARAGDRRGALFALKRKKLFEKELQQCSDAHLTLENQIITLESARTQRLAVDALAAGVGAQKAINQEMNVGKLDDLIEDLEEQAAIQAELANVLTQSVSSTSNDAELLAELDQIEARQLDEALADAAPVPTTAVAAPLKGMPGATDEEQLEQLMQRLH